MSETVTEVRRRADVCAVAIAEAFRGDGEILVSPMGTLPSIGARLARLTFEPDILLSRRRGVPARRRARRSARRSRRASSKAGSRIARCSTSSPPAAVT